MDSVGILVLVLGYCVTASHPLKDVSLILGLMRWPIALVLERNTMPLYSDILL